MGRKKKQKIVVEVTFFYLGKPWPYSDYNALLNLTRSIVAPSKWSSTSLANKQAILPEELEINENFIII